MTHHPFSRALLAFTLTIAAAACTPQPPTGGTGPGPDAGVKVACGNNVCDPGETPQSCANDCHGPVCGNSTCEAGETPQSCANDCHGPVCGNGTCEAGETQTSCAADCTATLVVQNTSSYTIYDLYAKRCTDAAWLPNQLGSYVISPNTQFTLNSIPPDCWDFKATSGSTYWQPAGIDMLAGHTYTWTLTN